MRNENWLSCNGKMEKRRGDDTTHVEAGEEWGRKINLGFFASFWGCYDTTTLEKWRNIIFRFLIESSEEVWDVLWFWLNYHVVSGNFSAVCRPWFRWMEKEKGISSRNFRMVSINELSFFLTFIEWLNENELEHTHRTVRPLMSLIFLFLQLPKWKVFRCSQFHRKLLWCFWLWASSHIPYTRRILSEPSSSSANVDIGFPS